MCQGLVVALGLNTGLFKPCGLAYFAHAGFAQSDAVIHVLNAGSWSEDALLGFQHDN